VSRLGAEEWVLLSNIVIAIRLTSHMDRFLSQLFLMEIQHQCEFAISRWYRAKSQWYFGADKWFLEKFKGVARRFWWWHLWM